MTKNYQVSKKHRPTLLGRTASASHIPLAIAILAFLAFTLLPALDRSAASEVNAPGLHAYWNRVARWAKG